MKRIIVVLSVIGFVSYGACKRSSQSVDQPLEDVGMNVKVLTGGLNFPWEITWGPDDRLWMTERNGKISRVDPITGSVTPLITITQVKAQGEGGLLGMVLHPDFSTNPEVFVAYNYDKSGIYTERVVKYTYNGSTLVNPVILLDNIPASSIHNGCRLLISADKKLYITTGDASISSSAQNLNSLSGKVLRINLDGGIPTDNPFSGNPVWSYGHRNAQGLVFASNKLYSSEHGASTDDEINVIEKGRNYGWPNVEGLCNTNSENTFCNANNVAQPIFSWSPTIAPAGMDYYNSNLIPQWKNSLLLAVLKNQMLIQLKLNVAGDRIESTQSFLNGVYGRLRDVCVAPDGKVYIITSNGNNDKLIVVDKK